MTFIMIRSTIMPYMYILQCSDGTYYTGSTWNLAKRFEQHTSGEGARYTGKRLPVTLVYSEYFESIKTAFEREKQVQNWSHAKKKALIEGLRERIHELSECRNETHYNNRKS
jgi:putative endonuclease